MQSHPIFPRIQLHDDTELQSLLGATIISRDTIHQWPLSCVQRIALEGGRLLAYKSQLQPSVEPEFYAKVSSRILPGYRRLPGAGECDVGILEWIDTPLLRDIACTESELVAHGRAVIQEIRTIGRDVPVFLDLARDGCWRGVVEQSIDRLRTHIASNRFRSITTRETDGLWRWAMSSDAISTVTNDPALVHGDLKASQVFVSDGGYKVIDWQRPLIGPPELDLVSILVSKRMDPRRHVDAATVNLFWFLLLRWAVQAQVELFPGFQGSLFEQWAATAVHCILNECFPLPAGFPPS